MVSMQGLDPEQLAVFEQIEKESQPVFVTGPAGTGKSTLLKALRDNSKDAEYALVVAFTGVAALNVEGMTIHSLALRTSLGEYEINVYRPLSGGRELSSRNKELASTAKLLIIDEVSMARADLIDALDRFFRKAKGNSAPFGGVRVVMFGDLRQLPPFVIHHQLTRKEKFFLQGYEYPQTPHFFFAHVFALTGIKTFELSVIKRQSDPEFVTHLNLLRSGKPDTATMEYFNSRANRKLKKDSLRLFSERRPARVHNVARLAALGGDSRIFKSFLRSEAASLEDFLGRVDNKPAPEILELKIGAKVMVLRNLDVQAGLVNGASGAVVSFTDDRIDVCLERDGSIHGIERSTWDIFGPQLETVVDAEGQARAIISRKKIGEFVQFPLMLAWAVTIHKAQGQTLDEGCISFDGDFHAPGQAYVAVSRLKTIQGLGFVGTMTREHVKPFDQWLERFVVDKTKPSRSLLLRSETAQSEDFQLALLEATKRIGELLPWVDSKFFCESLSSGEIIGQVVDRAGYDLAERLEYLYDEYGVTLLDYLVSEFVANPANFDILVRNIDRSRRNRVMLIDIGDWTVFNSDEVFLRRELEVTGLEFVRFRRALGRRGAIAFLREHHVGKVQHGVEKLRELGLEDQVFEQHFLGF